MEHEHRPKLNDLRCVHAGVEAIAPALARAGIDVERFRSEAIECVCDKGISLASMMLEGMIIRAAIEHLANPDTPACRLKDVILSEYPRTLANRMLSAMHAYHTVIVLEWVSATGVEQEYLETGVVIEWPVGNGVVRGIITDVDQVNNRYYVTERSGRCWMVDIEDAKEVPNV